MRWDLYADAVAAALRVSHDEDIARDAALNALEECGDAPAGHIMRRARDRAKDIIRSQRRAPPTLHLDVDLYASGENVEDDVALRQHKHQLVGAVGVFHGTIIGLVHAGYTNAEIGGMLGVSEEQARKFRKSAESAAQDFNEKGH